MSYAEVLPPGLADDATLKLGELATMLRVTTKTVHEWCKAGRLPKPMQYGPRTFIFRVGELRQAFLKMSQPKPASKKRR